MAADPKAEGTGTPDAAGGPLPCVGTAIRRFRHVRGLSLQQLAEASDLSIGMLSQIERNLANPSLRVLTNIRQALQVPLSALFAEEEPDLEHPEDPPFVRRAGHRPRLDLGADHMVKEMLSPAAAQDLQFMVLRIPPGGTSGDQSLSYACEKAGLVLEGSLALTVGGQSARLEAGDSFQFWGATPHSFGNVGPAEASVVWIIARTLIERHL